MEQPSKQPPMFAEAEPPRAFPATAVGIAVVAVVLLAAVLVMLARRPATPAGDGWSAAYAPQLELTDEHMSEADSRDGFGKLIYIEGHVVNHGSASVSGVRVQVSFPGDQGAQVETVPMNAIVMREPYVDIRAIGPASPLAPGAGADFRLIFDDVKDSWNQQMPELRVTGVLTR